jgi:hypothetical protein
MVVAESPEFGAAVRRLFDSHRHNILGTLRKDGSPRLSGIEVTFLDDDVWFGGMWMSRKCLDLRRDPRFALHTSSVDPPAWAGDARMSGVVQEVVDKAQFEAVVKASGGEADSDPSHLFRAELEEVVLTRLGDPADHLVIELWRPGRGVRRTKRR